MFFQALTYFLFKSQVVRLRALFAAFAFFILSLTAQQISAATFTVINTADSGAGSLRQAVLDANATNVADTISFEIPSTDSNCDSSGVCTINLTGGVIMYQAAGGDLTISNQTGASKLIISGNNVSRIFQGDLGANLVLNGLTVTREVGGANSGVDTVGVITNLRGVMTIRNSIITQNAGDNIVATQSLGPVSTLNIINTNISNNTGCGVFSYNAATNGGTLNVLNSTVSNNISTVVCGGVRFVGDRLNISNSTISGNRSTSNVGGVFIATPNPGSLSSVITNSTITANSSLGVDLFQATTKFRNTIVAGNSGADVRTYNSAATSLGYNLIGTTSASGLGGANFQPSEILNGRDIRLAPLADNGGATLTHALLPDSPAINAGGNCVITANGCGDNNLALPTDQRGRPRVGTVDIGAYEATARPSFDFDGDGKSDVAVFRPSDGVWYRLNSSNNSFNAVQFGTSTDKIAPADYDGDGKTDIAVFREGAFAYFYILDSSTNTFRFAQFGTTGDVPMSGDWDGDRKADLAVYRDGATGNFYYRPTSQPNVDYFTLPLGTQGDKPLYGDFDGDGKIDAAVYRQSNATWYIRRSSSGGITQTAFGLSTDIPVPADYDGDGATNIAVFRPSNGTWYTSQNAAINYGAVVFGTSGDVPVPTDYDGDGTADVAVYRPSAGAWYLNRSTQGFTGVAFGDANDRPIPNAFIR